MSHEQTRAEQLAGIPETITREAYLALVRGAGFEIDDLVSLRFNAHSIEAVVFALDSEGKPYPGDHDEAAVHQISIKVVD